MIEDCALYLSSLLPLTSFITLGGTAGNRCRVPISPCAAGRSRTAAAPRFASSSNSHGPCRLGGVDVSRTPVLCTHSAHVTIWCHLGKFLMVNKAIWTKCQSFLGAGIYFNNNSVALKCLCCLSLFSFVCWVNTEHRRSSGLRAGRREDKAKKGVTLPLVYAQAVGKADTPSCAMWHAHAQGMEAGRGREAARMSRNQLD